MRVSRALGVLILSFFSSAVAAQDERSAAVAGTASAINMDANTSWSVGASFEYRFNRVAGLEVETTFVPSLKSSFPGSVILGGNSLSSTLSGIVAPTIFPAPSITNESGRAVILTNNVRVHVPTTTDRIDPFFVAGGGVSNVRRTAQLIYNPIPFPELTGPGLAPTVTIRPVPITTPLRSSSTALALTIGGGVGVRVLSRLWIEGDLRLFRLLESDDQNLGRFGVGARFRF